MCKILCFILYILQYIFFINGQNVQPKPTEHACTGSTLTLRCPNYYVVVVRGASYGVAQITGSCTYSAGDCIADAMNIIACTTDSLQCAIYATRKNLPECNNQYSSYIRVEYDCVPMSMDDPAKEYNVCQNNGAEITTDNGLIRSPGYPAQFQITTVECTRAIHVPSDKTIRLWLSDLYIGSTSTNCANDHVFVLDSVQTHRHCGLSRYAYPYLCSSTILIQYLVKTQATVLSRYRGMRMFFEIVDRPPNDGCPNSNGTIIPVPATTTIITTINPGIPTTAPIYVILGIASPLRSFQLCKGQSYTIECPNNYAVAVTNNIFGVTQSDQCEPYDAAKHCIITTDPTFACRQRCSYTYSGNRVIPSCNNKTAAYQYVEYQCIPTNTEIVSPNISCSINGSKIPVQINHRGRFQSYNYPNLKKMNCTYRLKTEPGSIMHVYSLDISLNDYSPNCQSNKITLIKDGENQGSDFCEQRSYSLIYSSCSNEVDLHYVVTNDAQLFSMGVDLYIESQARSSNWFSQSSLSATVTNEPLPTWAQYLEISPIFSVQVCLGMSNTLQCPRGSDYVVSIIESNYGVTGTGLCEIPSLSHCHQQSLLNLTCTYSCFIEYNISKPLSQCGNQIADYLHIDYQCIPTRLPNNENSIDICSSLTVNTSEINSGILISPEYPTLNGIYTCSKRIETLSSKLWMIYIVDLFFEGENNLGICNTSSLTVYDGNNKLIRCGLQRPELVLISCSNIVEFYFISTRREADYRGFKLYFKTIDKPNGWECLANGFTTTTTLIPPTFQIPAYGGTTMNGTRQYCQFPFTFEGNQYTKCISDKSPDASPIQNLTDSWCSLTNNFDIDHQWGFCQLGVTNSTIFDICRNQSQVLQCPSGYVIHIITADYAVKSNSNIGLDVCIYDKNDCFQNDESTIQNICAGRPSCTIDHVGKPLISCQYQSSAYLHIDYTCVPDGILHINTYDICNSNSLLENNIRRGYIISPNYPNTPNNIDCTFNLQTLKPYEDMYVYILDMNLNNPDLPEQNCIKDRLIIKNDDGISVRCGQPYTNLLLKTCHKSLLLQLIRLSDAQGHGVKLYFEFRNRLINDTCEEIITTSTRSTLSTVTSISTLARNQSTSWSTMPSLLSSNTTLSSTSINPSTTKNSACANSSLSTTKIISPVSTSISSTIISTIPTTTISFTTSQRSMAITDYDSNHILMFCIVMAKFILEHFSLQ